MPAADRRLLEDRHRASIADLVRVRSGRIPGTTLLDLQSEGGFLADRVARRAEDWIVYAAQLSEEPPGNVEEADVDLPELGFEDGELAAVMASAVDEPLDVSPELAEELHRVLGDDGRVLIAYRGPGPRATDVVPRIPPDAAQVLEDAGFEDVTDTREQKFRDGSQLQLLRAVKG